ncbi:MAG: lipopolysaccharide biosynthesis protein RfbH [Bdellovibrionales bacterium]
MEEKQRLRDEILKLTKKYYEVAFQQPEFIPGQSYVNYGGRFFDHEELQYLVDSSLDFWLTAGRYCDQFEDSLRKFLKTKACLLTTSGSSANLLAFMALTSDTLGDRKVLPGDEMITVAAGFPTTVSPAVQYGAIPVFVDVDIPSYNINIDQMKQALSEKTKVVMIAHTLGNPFNLEEVTRFCKENNLWLIEDNCDALGTKYNGKYTGTFGDLATCSFYPAHHMTTGEGGAVFVNNPYLKKVVQSIRDWGRDCWCPGGKDNTCEKRFDWDFEALPKGYDHKYVYSHFGYNLKVTEMQAAVGCAQLKKLPQIIESRRANHSYLKQGLSSLEKYFVLPEPETNSEPSWFGFLLTVKEGAPFKKVDVVRFLEKNLIQTRMLFAGNLLMHPCFDQMRKTGKGYRVVGDLVKTNEIMHNTFWLGVYPGMSEDKLDYMIDKLKEFTNQYES